MCGSEGGEWRNVYVGSVGGLPFPRWSRVSSMSAEGEGLCICWHQREYAHRVCVTMTDEEPMS